jgi:hypothetical protein
MVNKNTITDRLPPLYAPATTESRPNEPASAAQQGAYERWVFEQFVAAHPIQSDQTSQELPGKYSPEDATAFIASLLQTTNKESTNTPTIDRQYYWLQGTDPKITARLMNEIDEFRSAHEAKTGKLPPDSRCYREIRLKLERNTDDPYLNEAVRILDALMDGDFIDGTLPF